MKRSLAFLLACLMVWSCSSGVFTTQAEEIDYTCGENLTWSLDSETKTLTISGTGRMKDYSDDVNDPAPWQKYSSTIENIVVDDGVTYIGNSAFYKCSQAKAAIIGEGVQAIGVSAFFNCANLKTIQLPSTLREIYSQAFLRTLSLEDISFPNGCNLMWIDFGIFKEYGNGRIISKWYDLQPDGCVYLGDVLYTYKGTMPENTTINVREGTRVIQADFRNMVNLVDLNVPDSVISIGSDKVGNQGIFDGTTWLENQKANTNGVIYAGKVAYCFSGVMQAGQEIVLDEGTKGIASYAFYKQTLLSKLIIPDSLICVQGFGVYSCENLQTPDISHIQYLYQYALNLHNTETLTVPASLRWMQKYAFYIDSSTKQIIFEDNAIITELRYSMYEGRTVRNVQLANNLQKLGTGALYNFQRLQTILIPPSVQSIEQFSVGAFTSVPTIQCFAGSYAHTFALENDYPFELLDGIILDTDSLNEQLSAAKAVQRDLYTPESLNILDAVVAAVQIGAQTTQKTVDEWAVAIQKAIADLEYKSADYTEVNIQIQNAQNLNRDLYSPESLQILDDTIAAVDWDLPIVRQDEVDGFASAIAEAIRTVAYRTADYSLVEAAIKAAQEIERVLYSESSLAVLDAAVNAVIYDLDITRQTQVNEYATRIDDAISGLLYCSVVLRNDPHGVLVSATAREIHPETNLAVDEIDPSVYEIADFAVGGHIKSVRYYDITLFRQTQIVQPDGMVEVKIKLSQGVDPAKCRVYHVTEDIVDPLVRMASSLDGNYIVFNADHFSEYAVVEVETVLDRIEITALPQKTQYVCGESFAPDGIQVTAYYSDGTRQVIGDYDISAVDTSSPGEKTVSVYYTFNGTTKSDQFKIQVVTVTPYAQITVNGAPTQKYDKRVRLFRPYKKETVSLNCEISGSDKVKIEWSSDNKKVSVDQNGNVTNKGVFGARKATITATVKDDFGNVLTSVRITVRFYKFNFQLKKLNTQNVAYWPNKMPFIIAGKI